MVKPKETTANFKPEIGSGPHAVYHLFERLEAGRRRPRPARVGVKRVNLN